MHAVVDRVEGARGEEVEVAPLRVEGRRVIAEVASGGGNRPTARDFVEAQGGAARRGAEREGEPGAVGGPGERFATPVFAASNDLHGILLEVGEQHLVAMVGDGEEPCLGRSFHRHHAADVGVERALGALGKEVQPLLARGIAYRDEAAIG